MEQIEASLSRRACYEVAGWDGLRWVLEGVFDTATEATAVAKQVLGRRRGVRVTEEAFSDADGMFKSRVIFTEHRDGALKAERKPVETATATPPRHRGRLLASTDSVLYVGISALVISIISMVFSLAR